MDNNVLTHAGLKGMKWGVRRFQNPDGTLTPAGKKRYAKKTSDSEDYTRAKALKKKKLRQLSNAELKELNNRMQLESQYRNLKKQNVSAGKKFVQDVAYETAKNTAADYAKKYAKKGISAVAEKGVLAAYKMAAKT